MNRVPVVLQHRSGTFRPPALQTLPSAVSANVVELRARTRSTIMAVVKADGCGHGAATVAKAAVAEDVVPGREIDVGVLREADGCRWASPPLEIQTDGLFDTQSKYDGSARFCVPADIDRADRAALTGAALRMFDALGCAGVAGIDFFLTDDGRVLNEVNTMPGMTAESQVSRMFAATGLPYEQLVERLVDAATVPGPTSPGEERVKP